VVAISFAGLPRVGQASLKFFPAHLLKPIYIPMNLRLEIGQTGAIYPI
jgi:hypothetical protein